MHHPELGEAQRQVAIALQSMFEYLDVARAVHRLQREPALVLGLVAGRLRLEHVLAIPVPVARRFPQPLVEDLRRVDLVIVAGQAAAHIGDQSLEDGPALRVPEHHARTFLLEVEQVEFAAEPAVVALLRFLDLLEIEVEVVLLGEGGAIDARQHLVVAVAAPIGAGHLHQLEGVADLAGRCHVRAAAQVEPVALLVDADGLVFRDCIDQLDLEALALVREHALGLVAGPDFLGEGFVARDDLAHLLLDRREVLGRERFVAEEVVIESVLDHRADGDLRAGPQCLHGFGQDMRGVVADQFERAGVVAVDEFDARILLDRIDQVAQFAIERHRDRPLGQRWRNALDDIEAGGALREAAVRAVRKGDGDVVGGFDGLEIGEAELESGSGRLVVGLVVGHGILLWLTPANERG